MESQSLLQNRSVRIQLAIITIVVILSAIAGAYLVASGALPEQYNLNLGEAVPAIEPPDDYSITVFATELAAPRYMVVHPTQGVLIVSERGSGRVLGLTDTDTNRIADDPIVIADDLVQPSGLAWHGDWLYVAQIDRITRLQLDENLEVIAREDVVTDLPTGRNENEFESNLHALLIHNDTLYVSIEASCSACEEDSALRATVMAYDLDGSNERVFARGLYRVLGMAVNPVTNEIWVSVQGRPEAGDVPESIYAIAENDNLGWPICHAGTVPDPDLGSDNSCDAFKQPLIQIVGQSNITDILFYTDPNAPSDYQGDLLAVLHGGVTESERQVGMGILWLEVDPDSGEMLSTEERSFVSGFWRSEEPGDHLGRPFALALAPDGTLYISDDAANAIYQLTYNGD